MNSPLQQDTRLAQHLLELTERVIAGTTPEEILEHLYATFKSVIPYNRIGLALIEDSGEGRLVRSVWNRSEAEHIRINRGYMAPLKGSSLEKILETGRPRILNDLEMYLQEHPRSHSTYLILEEGVRSSLTCPLEAFGQPVGFLFFSSFEKETYKNAHVEVFQQIAGHLSISIEKGRMYQQLVEMDKMRNKFLGIVAHDLRSPLAIIRSYLNVLLEDMLGPLADKQRKMLDRCGAIADSMMDMINDLLDVTVIQSGQLKLEDRGIWKTTGPVQIH